MRTVKGTAQLITQALVDEATRVLAEHGDPDELVIRDEHVKGFQLRLRATGRHAYYVAYGRGQVVALGQAAATTAKKARERAKDALIEARHDGRPRLAERKAAAKALTLDGFLTEHYTEWAEAHLKTPAETLARIRVQFAALLDTPLAKLTAFDVERWRSARLKAKKRPATINRDLVALKAALAKAVTWGLLKAHPLTAVKPARVDTRGVVRYLEPDEDTRLRKALEDRDTARRAERERANVWRRERGYDEWAPLGDPYSDHLTPLVLLALNTGLRRGELFALRWRDVDLGRALLTVRGDGAKSGQTRYVPLNTEAVRVLTAWEPLPAAPRDARVFPSPADPAQPLQDIKSAWRPLLTAANLTRFRFHDCRHHFASKLVQAGVDLNTVRELLGHADTKMVLRYAHLSPDVKAAAVAKLVSAS